MSTGRRISRVCAVAAVTAAATLGAAGSAPAATKWLCGPGVAHDPCRPSLSTTFYRGWDTRVGRSTPRRDRDRGVDCFYVYPTVSNQQSRLATKHVDPEIRSIALYQAARFSQVCRVTRRCTGRRRSRRSRPARRRDATTSRPTVTSSRPSMRSFAASARAAGSSSSGTRRGASTSNGSSAGASTPTGRCAAGSSQPCSSAATSPCARSRTAVACSAMCPRAGARRSSRA